MIGAGPARQKPAARLASPGGCAALLTESLPRDVLLDDPLPPDRWPPDQPPDDSYDLDDLYDLYDADSTRAPRDLDQDNPYGDPYGDPYDDLPPMSRVDWLEWQEWAGVEQDQAEREMLRLKAPAWVFLPPGAELAAELETLRPQCESPIALIEAMKAAARIEAWAASIRTAAQASFVRQRKAQLAEIPRPSQIDSTGRPIDPERSWAAEIGAALHLSKDTAARHIDTALHLTGTLSATHAALRCGALTFSKALAISEATRALPPAAAQAVQAHVLRRAAGQTHRNLNQSLRRQVAKHTVREDADKHRAAIADRTCKIVPLADGMAGLWVVHTADKIQQMWIVIQAMADLAKRGTPTAPASPATDANPTSPPPTAAAAAAAAADAAASDAAAHTASGPPTIPARRTAGADATTDATATDAAATSAATATDATATAATGATAAATATATDGSAADATATGTTGTGATGATATDTGATGATATGATGATATGGSAADARDATDAASGLIVSAGSGAASGVSGAGRDERIAPQRRADAVSDVFEHMLHNGLDWLGRRLPDQHRRRPHIEVLIPITTLLGMDDDPAELAGYGPIPASMARRIAAGGTWRRLLTDPTNGTVVEASTTRHDPGAVVTETLLARHPVCAWPGCNRVSRECDRDHGTPFARSGETRLAGLAPFCEYHHLIKDTPAWGWSTINHSDGSVTLTAPTGHRYTTIPPARGPAAPSVAPFGGEPPPF
ncbi:hypothetical protein [Kribbella sp. NPDC004536]|uniref:HNH endonuclease signature motif containing protein n=1 Tax=Kribbella sp. NPDC004536 TaxID=3364106 RepID=UPI00368EF7AE